MKQTPCMYLSLVSHWSTPQSNTAWWLCMLPTVNPCRTRGCSQAQNLNAGEYPATTSTVSYTGVTEELVVPALLAVSVVPLSSNHSHLDPRPDHHQHHSRHHQPPLFWSAPSTVLTDCHPFWCHSRHRHWAHMHHLYSSSHWRRHRATSPCVAHTARAGHTSTSLFLQLTVSHLLSPARHGQKDGQGVDILAPQWSQTPSETHGESVVVCRLANWVALTESTHLAWYDHNDANYSHWVL